jgi:hypothetical protein
MYGEGNPEAPWKDSISSSVMYIANIPAGMQLWQIGSYESLYRLPISLPDFPGPREVGTNSADS